MGVQDQIPFLSVNPINPSSPVLEGAEMRLRSNGYLAMKNVTCDYHEGTLTLRGCVPSYFLKQMAQTAVARLDGVERVVNDIVVINVPRR